jgi:hypothetical protein
MRSCTSVKIVSKLLGLNVGNGGLTIVDGEHTSTGNTTENVGTSTLEERSETLGGKDLASSIQRTLVLYGLARRHHHATTDSVEWVRSDTSTSGDSPAKHEGGQEVTFERTDQENRLDGVVHAEVQTTIDDDTDDGRSETTVETGNSIGSEGLAIDIDQAVELTSSSALGRLGVVGKTGTILRIRR